MKEVVLSVGHLKPSKKFPQGAISNGSMGEIANIKARRCNNAFLKELLKMVSYLKQGITYC